VEQETVTRPIWRSDVERLVSAFGLPKSSSRLLWALLREPSAFRLMSEALSRYGAIQKPLELYGLIRFIKRVGHDLDNVMKIGTWKGGDTPRVVPPGIASCDVD
jgi:hypothetical protein